MGEQYGVSDCCRVFEVNRSSYYAWRQRQGKTNLEREALKVVLVKYHKASRGSAGARTLSEDLRGAGHQVGRYMARSLMKEAGIASRQRRPHKYKSSGVESLVAEHELEREFYVVDINKVWCADITYIQLGKALSRIRHQRRYALSFRRNTDFLSSSDAFRDRAYRPCFWSNLAHE